jgi:hypothetical protein
MQIERPMGLAAMQKDRYTRDGDVGDHQREEQRLPPGEAEQPLVKKVQHPRQNLRKKSVRHEFSNKPGGP